MNERQTTPNTHPTSPFEQGVINLLMTDNYISSKLKSFLDDFDVTTQQYNILRILRGQYPEPATNNEVKERMLYKSADTSRLVDRLYEKGLVTREQCPDDRRRVDICISEKGLQLLDHIDEEINEVEEFLGNLNESEVKELNRLLEKIRE